MWPGVFSRWGRFLRLAACHARAPGPIAESQGKLRPMGVAEVPLQPASPATASRTRAFSVVHRLPAWPMPLRKRCLAGRTLRFVGVAVVCVCVRGPVRRLPAADGGKGQSRLARTRRGHDTGNSGKCAPRSRLGVTTLLAGVTDVSCVVAVHCTGWRGGSPQSVSIGGPLGHQRMLPQCRRGSRCTPQRLLIPSELMRACVR